MKRFARSLTLIAALATVGVTGIPAAEAQNAAAQRGDRLVGPKVTEGRITWLDRSGRIVLVDGRRFLVHDAVASDPLDVPEEQRRQGRGLRATLERRIGHALPVDKQMNAAPVVHHRHIVPRPVRNAAVRDHLGGFVARQIRAEKPAALIRVDFPVRW